MRAAAVAVMGVGGVVFDVIIIPFEEIRAKVGTDLILKKWPIWLTTRNRRNFQNLFVA